MHIVSFLQNYMRSYSDQPVHQQKLISIFARSLDSHRADSEFSLGTCGFEMLCPGSVLYIIKSFNKIIYNRRYLLINLFQWWLESNKIE